MEESNQDKKRPFNEQLMFLIATFIVLYSFWILLSGKFDMFHLALGGISCLIVALISSDLLLHNRQKGFAARLGEDLLPTWRRVVFLNFPCPGATAAGSCLRESHRGGLCVHTVEVNCQLVRSDTFPGCCEEPEDE